MSNRSSPKIDYKSEKIWVTILQQRYGKNELTTLLVPNPNFKGRKKKHRRD